MKTSWKRKAVSCFIACLALLFTGCWDYREPHMRNIIIGISIDFAEGPVERHDGRRDLAVSLQTPIAPLLEPEESGSDVAPEFFTVTGVGRTLTDAIFNTRTRLSRELFLGHVTVVLVSEEVARSRQFNEILDELLRNPSFDKMLTLLIARDAPAREVLDTLPAQETIPSLYINRFVSKKDGQDRSRIIRLWDVWRLMNTPGAEISVGGIQAKGNELEISGTAVFKGTQMIGWMDPIETRGAEFLRGEVNLAVITFSVDEDVPDYDVLEKLSSSRRITPHLEGDHVRFVLEIRVEGSLRSKPANTLRLNQQQIERLESAAARLIESEVRAALDRLIEFNSDILELGALTRRKFPTEWRERIDWDEWFPRSQFEIDVKVNLRRTGSML